MPAEALKSEADFRIRPFLELPIHDILPVLNQSFGVVRDEQWFRWKHEENPQGKSIGWVAEGPEGILGVRILLQWKLMWNQTHISALRPVDTATLPAARNRGIFQCLTEYAYDHVSRIPGVDLIFNTPNKNSIPGYKKMGWSILPSIKHGIAPAGLTSTAELDYTDRVLESWNQVPFESDRLVTERNPAYMRWRYDSRSGLRYEMASLRESDRRNAIVYRIVEKYGIRLVIIEELIGSEFERRTLVRSVAKREGAMACLVAKGSGALRTLNGPMFSRGSSVLAVRPVRALEVNAGNVDAWALTLGDLERVI